MALINYLPNFLQEIKEYKEITDVEEQELEGIKEINNSLPSEISIETATEVGLERYEKILGLKKNTNLSLEDRRFLVKNKFLNRAPFTVNWLSNKLKTLCGKDNYSINVDYEVLSLEVQIGYMFEEATEELRKDLKNIIPANLNLQVNFWYVEDIKQKQVIAISQGEILTIKQIN